MLGFFAFNLVFWLLTTFTLSVIIVGFAGAVKRSPRHLRFYGGASITLIMVGLVFAIMIVTFQPQMNEVDYDTPATVPSSNPDPANPTAQPLSNPSSKRDVPADPLVDPNTQPQPEPMPAEVRVNVGGIIFCVIVSIFGLVAFALKLATIVMAFRIANMLQKDHRLVAHKEASNNTEQEMSHQTPAYPQVIYVPVPVNPQQGMTPFAFPQNGQPVFYNPYLVKGTN